MCRDREIPTVRAIKRSDVVSVRGPYVVMTKLIKSRQTDSRQKVGSKNFSSVALP